MLKIASDKVARADLKHEARLLGMCSHPHVVALIEADPSGRWLAAERVPGTTLDTWSRGKPISEILRVIFEFISAVQHLHGVGIVHGDIKPPNVLVDSEGHPKLIDLGAAQHPDANRRTSATLGFAAPEVLAGEVPSKASDVYGIGALLFAALTGRPPIDAPDPAALAWLPLQTVAPSPAEYRWDVPDKLDKLVLQMLNRAPGKRPDLARLVELLLEAESGNPPAPVVGMHSERARLRRAVASAADGSPSIVVVYGPPGSGRKTLLQVAMRSARREGLEYVKTPDDGGLFKAIREAKTTPVAVCSPTPTAVAAMKRLVLGQVPCLVMFRSESPVPALKPAQAVHITPSPLTPEDVRQLARIYGADPRRAVEWHHLCQGLPRAARRLVKAHAHGNKKKAISRGEFQVIDAVRANGSVDIDMLAKLTRTKRHTLLDLCESLVAQNLLEFDDLSHTFRLIRSTEK